MKDDKKIINNEKKVNERHKKLILITLVTVLLIFIIYIFITQFITFKKTDKINSTLILNEYSPS